MARYSRFGIWSARSPLASAACVAVVAAAMLASGCGAKKTVALDVDLYLHAGPTEANDVLLQAGIGKRLADDAVTKRAIVHVRVTGGVVALNGAVRSQAIREAAVRIARETVVTLNGTLIQPVGEIGNHLDVDSIQ